jgi:hypothetical protein
MNNDCFIPRSVVVGWGIAAMLWAGSGLLWAEGEEGSREGVKKYGLVHNIAEDRRVEKVGGLYEPEGLDLYMKRHMDVLEEQIKGLKNKLDTMDRKLDEVSGLIQGVAENSRAKEVE